MPTAGHLSDAEIREIVGRASNLAERLRGEVIPLGRGMAVVEERLARWKRLAVGNDEAAFHRVLSDYGSANLSEPDLLLALGQAELPIGRSLPSWASLLQEIVAAVAAAFSSRVASGADTLPCSRRPIPFAALYSPISALARRMIEEQAPKLAALSDERAWLDLERHLITRLSAICSLALQPRFLAFKAVEQSDFPFGSPGEKPQPSKNSSSAPLFDRFVADQGADGLANFFFAYPVAGRLVAQATQLWIEFVTEFLERWERDQDAISADFFSGLPTGKIASIKAGISDPHQGGRFVLILKFRNGTRVVYKPRPMQIDAAFGELLEWMNAQGHQPLLRTPKILLREGYGWESCVKSSPCLSRQAAEQFHRRAGVLLYLLHILRGIDIHCENMIAAGDHPVLVDLEALCHPPFPASAENADAEADAFDASVLRVGMLPLWESCFREDRSICRTALGSPVRQQAALAEVQWTAINSDAMEARRRLPYRFHAEHRPKLHGKMLPPQNFLRELIGGFEGLARAVRADEKLAAGLRSRLATMDEMESRHIKRPTLGYLALIRNSLRSSLLSDGLERSLALQALPHDTAANAGRAAEIAALEALDVPYFKKLPPTSTSSRNAALTDEELARQIALIKRSVTQRLAIRRGRIEVAGLARRAKYSPS